MAVSLSTSSTSQGPTISSPPQSLLKPMMDFPRKLLMGPGPSNSSPRVLAAGALPLLGHMNPEFFKIMDEVKEGIQYAFQTKNWWTFAVSGSGHAAMEAAVANILEPGEVALVGVNGFWGERIADMIDRNGSVVKTIVRPMGEVFTLGEIEKLAKQPPLSIDRTIHCLSIGAPTLEYSLELSVVQGLKEHKPALVFVTYGESSGGTRQPLEGLADLCHKYNALLLVDSVAILGGYPLYMDDWNIDILYAGSQKVLSVPPATSPISFSQRARDKIASRKTRVRSFYFDAKELANYWGCDDEPRRYHHTEFVTNVYQLREGLARLAEEGLEKSWKDHKACSELLYEGLEKLGLELVVKDKAVRNPCVTPVKVPPGVNWKDVIDYVMTHYLIEIAPGVGDLAGKAWRIGVLGYNCTPDNVLLTLKALGEALNSVRK